MSNEVTTDAGPTPDTLAILVGANTGVPNNFMPPPRVTEHQQNLQINSSTTRNETSVVNNVLNNAPNSVIQVENASNFQIGNSFSFNFSPKKKSKTKSSVTKQKPGELPALLRSDLRVTTTQIKGIKGKIGEPWRFVMRHLNLTDAEIENKHEEYINKGGIEEVQYQLIRLWTEKNGSAATLEKFSTALYKENQFDALNFLCQIYGK